MAVVRELPIFPLPVVLFPGAPLPLHVFEPRYQRLLADCLESDRRFGVSFAQGQSPTTGSVGCRALIRATNTLQGGRSHIVVLGEDRYVLLEWVDRGTPYRVGRVRDFHDQPEDQGRLAELSDALRHRFSRLIGVLRELSDEADVPLSLASEPEALTFQVSAALELEPAVQQELLAIDSTPRRISRLTELLEPMIRDLERRAVIARRSRGNGKGDGPPVLEREG